MYATAGTAANGGMDRGRELARMDAELLACVSAQPQNAQEMDFSQGNNGTAFGTRIWWGDAVFGEAKIVGDRLQRTASVTVMSLAKAGEL